MPWLGLCFPGQRYFMQAVERKITAWIDSDILRHTANACQHTSGKYDNRRFRSAGPGGSTQRAVLTAGGAEYINLLFHSNRNSLIINCMRWLVVYDVTIACHVVHVYLETTLPFFHLRLMVSPVRVLMPRMWPFGQADGRAGRRVTESGVD